MANLILRANIADNNVVVEYKLLPLPLANNIVELVISANPGYLINKENFSHGLLPSQVSSISFEQAGSNVLAIVVLSKFLNKKVTQNISLPIISKSVLNIDTFKLNNIFLNKKDIISKGNSSFIKTTNQDKEVYNIRNKTGETILVLSQTLVAIDKFYFSSEPTFIVTGNPGRYTSNNEIFRDSNNNIIRKVFNIYYTSPVNLIETNQEDTIRFTAPITQVVSSPVGRVATKKEEYEIYSFDGGRDIGTEGGIKVIKVKGVPGSQFKIILQDSDKKTYNFKTGIFEAGGGMLIGEIPPRVNGESYGEYIAWVNIPKALTNNSIETLFTTDRPIDHAKLHASRFNDNSDSGFDNILQSYSTPTTIAVERTVPSRFTFAFSNSDFTVSNLTTDVSTLTSAVTMVTSYGNFGEASQDINFVTTISSTDLSKVMTISRQPLASDWEISASHLLLKSSYSIQTSAQLEGRVVDSKSATVTVKGVISNIKHGKGDVTVTLDLTNFLTLSSL